MPQVEALLTPHLPLGSAAPDATGEHVPGVALSVHDTQAPSQVALQQTFCAEHTRPEAHWLFAVQGPPFGSRPHEPFMHVALHTVAPHAYGKHEVAPGVVHLPAPSQIDFPVKVIVVEGQVGSLHFVPEAYF